MDTERLVIAVKREKRNEFSESLSEAVSRIPGVTIIGGGEYRLQVLATPSAISALKEQLSEYCHIEHTILHMPGQVSQTAKSS